VRRAHADHRLHAKTDGIEIDLGAIADDDAGVLERLS